VPHITFEEYEGLEGTVLDGEMFLNDFKTTSSIMGSGSARAVAKQEADECISYHAFDILSFRGKDVRTMPLEKRRKLLKEVVRRMANPWVKVIDQHSISLADELFAKFVSNDGEGLIIKDLRMSYGQGWAKRKKSYDVSCFISGYKPGDGKYKGMIGSIEISVFDGDRELAVGFASGFNDRIRAEMSKGMSEYLGAVVDVYAHELSDGLRLRHPTFFRFRDDLNAEDCTLEKLKDDFKKKAKSTRWRAS
jgi:ATP-dependent DNA ligase